MSILFPAYDAIGVEQARVASQEEDAIDFTLENIQYEIEECKYQTTLIQEQTTAKGNKTWDLPRIKGVVTEGIKTRLKKDHFTSLLLANDAARSLSNTVEPSKSSTFGGYSSKEAATKRANGENMYQGRGLKRMKNSDYAKAKPPIRRLESGGGSIAY
jgi:hypothetical protein